MKIDYSKWIIRIVDSSGICVSVENPSEGISLATNMDLYKVTPDMQIDDPIKYIKELAKKEIRGWYLRRQFEYLTGKQIPVEDNLDYIENEAEKRGLV